MVGVPGAATWASLTSGTNSNAGTFAVSGNTWDFSGASVLKLAAGNTQGLPGTNGQLLYNNGGSLGAEDPIVSGPDARGAAQTKNPVATGGIDYTTNCSSGPCVQETKVDSSGQLYLGNFPASQAVTQQTSPWVSNITQVASTALGATAVVNYGSTPAAVAVPAFNAFVTNSVAVTGTFFQATQPVSGTVTANQGIPNTVANSWPIEVTNGTNTAAVKAASTAAATTDPALVVAVSPNNTVAVTQSTSPWVASCTTANCTVKADIFGNGGAALDQANGSAVPANGLQVGGGSVAGGTTFEVLTVKAASVAAAATDTSLVVQPLIGSHVMNTAAAGTQLVGVADGSGNALTSNSSTQSRSLDFNLVSALGATMSKTNPLFTNLTDGTNSLAAAVSALGVKPTGTEVMFVNTDQTTLAGNTLQNNVCATVAKTSIVINFATVTTTTWITGVSAKHTYLCSIYLQNGGTAQNVGFVAGTGTNCGTTIHVGYFGGTTAATELNLPANGAFTLGNGASVVVGGNDTAADNICWVSSGSGQVSGVATYVQN